MTLQPIPASIASPIHLRINATNIGQTMHGLARYSTEIAAYLWRHWQGALAVRSSYAGPVDVGWAVSGAPALPSRTCSRAWFRTSAGWAPELGGQAHLKRLWGAQQRWGNAHKPSGLLWTTSPLEACFWQRQQVITVHDLMPLYFAREHPQQHPFYRFVLPPILRRVRHVIAVSEATRQQLLQAYDLNPNNVTTIHNGAHPPTASTKEEESALPDDATAFLASLPSEYLLYIGRNGATKNIPGLLRGWHQLCQVYRMALPLALTLAPTDLPTWAHADVAAGRLICLGHVPECAMASLYRRASALVIPSFWEGFSLPAAEAMALGCPVVAASRGALPEVCLQAAAYFDPNDPAEMAHAIADTLMDSSKRKARVAFGQTRAAQLTWEKSARAHKALFETLI